MVFDGDVDVLPADGVASLAGRVGQLPVVLQVPQTADSLAGAALDLAELLTSKVDELARTAAFVPQRRLEADPAHAFYPAPFGITETVDCGIASNSAISAAVTRKPRRARIAATRSGEVRFATRRGAEDRSRRPRSPSWRYRDAHFRAQPTLTPAA